MKVLDSTVAIDYLRDYEPAARLLEDAVERGEWVGASEIVRFEVLVGVREEERERVERFFVALAWVAVDEVVSRHAASLARRFRAQFSGIDTVDYLIAATAMVLDAELLTTNVRHFPMLSGLRAPY